MSIAGRSSGHGHPLTAVASLWALAVLALLSAGSATATAATAPKRTVHPGHTVIPAQTVQLYYMNPLRRIRQLYAKRIDEGVDYSGSGSVTALGNATITVLERGTSSFWANQFGNVVVERMDGGPLAGISVYNAENCTPSAALHVGQHVTATTTLCHLHNQFPFMEIGFAQNNTSGVPAAWPVYHTVPDGSKTAYGVDFSHLLGDLGAPRGNTNSGTGDKSYHWHTTIGKLPRSFPRF